MVYQGSLSERSALIHELSTLPNAQFRQLVYTFGLPRSLSADSAQQGLQAVQFLEWIEGPSSNYEVEDVIRELARLNPPSHYQKPFKEPGREFVWHLKASLSVTFITFLLLASGIFGVSRQAQDLDLTIYDQALRTRAYQDPDDRILVISISGDEIPANNPITNELQQGSQISSSASASLAGDPHASISDQKLKELINKLNSEFQPIAIALDIYHPHKVPPVIASDNLFFICQRGDLFKEGLAEISKASLESSPDNYPLERVGFSSVVNDGLMPVIRRNLMAHHLEDSGDESGCESEFSLSFRLAMAYIKAKYSGKYTIPNNFSDLAKEGFIYNFENGVRFRSLTPFAGGYQDTITGQDIESKMEWNGGYQILLNYHSPPLDVAISLSLTDVLQDKEVQEEYKNKIIIIGRIDDNNDMHLTPYGPESKHGEIAGVWLQANMLSQFLKEFEGEHGIIWYIPDLLEWVWVLVGNFLLPLAGLIILTLFSTLSRNRSRVILVIFLAWLISLFSLYLTTLSFLWLAGGWVPAAPSMLSISLLAMARIILKEIGLDQITSSLQREDSLLSR